MSINAVASLSRDEASRALAAAVLSTMPTTGVDGDYESKHAKLTEAIIREVRQRFSSEVRANRSSEVTEKAFIQEVLAKEISQLLLSDTAREVALSRAGRAGRLGVGAYEITFDTGFADSFKPLGVRKHQAEKAMLSAEVVQHLPATDGDEGPVISLFLKRHAPRNLLSDHFLLVQALRSDSRLNVDAAWWIHPTLVDISELKQPVEYLKAFLEIYGRRISVEGKSGLMMQDVPLDGLFEEMPESSVRYPDGRGNSGLTFCGTTWNSETKKATIPFAYSVDIDKYRSDLKRIGAL